MYPYDVALIQSNCHVVRRLDERDEMNYPAASCGVSIDLYDIFSQSCHPRMFLSGVQPESRLDSR